MPPDILDPAASAALPSAPPAPDPTPPAPAPEPVASAPPAPDPTPPAPAPTPEAPKSPSEIPSLLEGLGKESPSGDKVEKSPDDDKSAEIKSAEPAEIAALTTWEFTLPETLKADDAQLNNFKGILNDLVTPKAGETRSQTAQRLVNLHNEALLSYADQLGRDQVSTFNNTRADWAKQAMADPQIGGAGHKTALTAIARMRDLTISDHASSSQEYQKDLADYETFLRVTGAGDHPVYLKQLHRMARYIDEPAPPPTNQGVPKDIGQAPKSRSLYAPK